MCFVRYIFGNLKESILISWKLAVIHSESNRNTYPACLAKRFEGIIRDSCVAMS